MAGLLIYPRGAGMVDEIGDGCENLVAPVDVPMAIGAFTTSDGPRVLVALPLPEGRWLTTEITLELLLSAADLFTKQHGDPRERSHCLRCGSRLSWR